MNNYDDEKEEGTVVYDLDYPSFGIYSGFQ